MLDDVELRELRIFLAVLVAAMRETGAQRSLVPRAAVPRQARVSFARALPCLIALWALGGFYLSLRPALAAALAASSNCCGAVRSSSSSPAAPPRRPS